ncbi:hypothetical protein SAMN06264364_12553 [Quadrisphaera granulorum]|uniref:Uncharacterized protein n=1 Tax=Quadrisphaera granulorum TaxID=317664 RepID=A0A315ZVF1_9ACTN|nr:hypothetical protein [Quadrisphaera granulorum]PWJ49586.1 hypothetical protein BXY45_12553 [Quadrisphaera granulorum]SZE98165.1 hypothetical protein SAMN06264364_12553 [Quadrisphaera granulorum]
MTRVKVEVSVPDSHVEVVLAALHEAGAGRVGGYDHCSSSWRVSGTWRPLAGAAPYLGRVGHVEHGEECRVESVCDIDDVASVHEAVRRVHPYEEPLVLFLPVYDPPAVAPRDAQPPGSSSS